LPDPVKLEDGDANLFDAWYDVEVILKLVFSGPLPQCRALFSGKKIRDAQTRNLSGKQQVEGCRRSGDFYCVLPGYCALKLGGCTHFSFSKTRKPTPRRGLGPGPCIPNDFAGLTR